jgi:hypothetical protein
LWCYSFSYKEKISNLIINTEIAIKISEQIIIEVRKFNNYTIIQAIITISVKINLFLHKSFINYQIWKYNILFKEKYIFKIFFIIVILLNTKIYFINFK